MDVSVITVTWNASEHIADQIRSVALACGGLEFEQIIVDNASSDHTVDVIRKEFPNVKLITNTTNVGFSKANNQGAKIAIGDFLLFLNPDMQMMGAGTMAKWLDWMKQNPKVGISGCKLITKDGGFNNNAGPRRFPTLLDQLMILLKIPHLFPSVLNKYLYKGFNPEIDQNVDSVRGSAMLMRRNLYEEMGFAFDQRYYFWYEDVDTCKEAYNHGYEVWYTPVVNCIDLVGTSFKKRYFWWKQVQFLKSMYRYFNKWTAEGGWKNIFLDYYKQKKLFFFGLLLGLFSVIQLYYSFFYPTKTAIFVSVLNILLAIYLFLKKEYLESMVIIIILVSSLGAHLRSAFVEKHPYQISSNSINVSTEGIFRSTFVMLPTDKQVVDKICYKISDSAMTRVRTAHVRESFADGHFFELKNDRGHGPIVMGIALFQMPSLPITLSVTSEKPISSTTTLSWQDCNEILWKN